MADFFWLIPFFPALSSLLLILFGRKLPRKYITFQACLAVFFSFALSFLSFLSLLGNGHEGHGLIKNLFAWIHSGSFKVDFSLQFDQLTAVMCLVVSGVGFLIHVYSSGYMSHDKSFARFFAYMNLFTFSMLILVMASNLVLMFVGWEGVGLCSYLLIGFWFEKPSAANAGKKAFIVNRIGDAGFMLGIFFILFTIGGVEFGAVNHAVEAGGFTQGLATLIALLLFVGAIGKSAQIPLYVWLPDAMEGPTPVSALIHAATMVTAGVYMVARMNLLYSLAPMALQVVAIVGALTAVYAASMALTQNDIKQTTPFPDRVAYGGWFLDLHTDRYLWPIRRSQ